MRKFKVRDKKTNKVIDIVANSTQNAAYAFYKMNNKRSIDIEVWNGFHWVSFDKKKLASDSLQTRDFSSIEIKEMDEKTLRQAKEWRLI